MIDAHTIKYIKSLHQKKFRAIHNEYIVEGVKMVNELLRSDVQTKSVYTTDLSCIDSQNEFIYKINDKELGRISALKTPNKVLAVAEIPEEPIIGESIKHQLSLVLENIQDPGNMGTIIRLANWYGINNIFCSPETVDCYNPKVVQATMGAIFRITVHYTNIYGLIEQSSEWADFKTYATHLHGQSIYDSPLTKNGFIIMGNESKGLSANMNDLPLEKIKLPPFPANSENMESLNVAVATALTVAEFRRRII